MAQPHQKLNDFLLKLIEASTKNPKPSFVKDLAHFGIKTKELKVIKTTAQKTNFLKLIREMFRGGFGSDENCIDHILKEFDMSEKELLKIFEFYNVRGV